MGLIPTARFGGFEQVQEAVESENIQRERIAQQQAQAQQAQAQEAFALTVQTQLRQREEARLRQADERRAQSLGLKQAVTFGIKYDPATKQYRQLRPEDAEFIPWREAQAEKAARRPETAAAKLKFAAQKREIETTGQIKAALGKEIVLRPGKELAAQREVEREAAVFDRELKARAARDEKAEARTLGRTLKREERAEVRSRAFIKLRQENAAELAKLRGEIAQGDPKRAADLRLRINTAKRVARAGLISARQALNKDIIAVDKDIAKAVQSEAAGITGAGELLGELQQRRGAIIERATPAISDAMDSFQEALDAERDLEAGLALPGLPARIPTGAPAQPTLPAPAQAAPQIAGPTAAGQIAGPTAAVQPFLEEIAPAEPGAAPKTVLERLSAEFGSKEGIALNRVTGLVFNNPQRLDPTYVLFEDPAFISEWAKLSKETRRKVARSLKEQGIIQEVGSKPGSGFAGRGPAGQEVTVRQRDPNAPPRFEP